MWSLKLKQRERHVNPPFSYKTPSIAGDTVREKSACTIWPMKVPETLWLDPLPTELPPGKWQESLHTSETAGISKYFPIIKNKIYLVSESQCTVQDLLVVSKTWPVFNLNAFGNQALTFGFMQTAALNAINFMPVKTSQLTIALFYKMIHLNINCRFVPILVVVPEDLTDKLKGILEDLMFCECKPWASDMASLKRDYYSALPFISEVF